MATGSIGWIHFDERDRAQVDQLLEAFRKPGMLDELGFGRVRDSFADLLAPGLSTQHTHVRYLLFLPWIFRRLQDEKLSGREFHRALKSMEVALIDALANGSAGDGIIGISSREKLSRFPSSIYWNGLLTWKIRQFPGSLREYGRVAGHPIEEDDDDGMACADWHPGLPEPPRDFLLTEKPLTFELRREDAAYLLDRIRENKRTFGNSLLGQLAEPRNLRVLGENTSPWSLPEDIEFTEPLQTTLYYAEIFSILANGANLLYNLLVIEARRQYLQTENRIAGEESLFRSFEKWRESSIGISHRIKAAKWDRLRDIVDAAPSHAVRWGPMLDFLDHWRDLVLSTKSTAELMDGGSRLIVEREQGVKSGRARLSNREALQSWKGISGTGRLTYRWWQIRSCISDLAMGLESQTR